MTINLILIAMRRIILSAALLLLSVAAFAQKHERKVTAFEAGYSVGVSGGASSFWSIGELFEQRKRVEKGWFPKREK